MLRTLSVLSLLAVSAFGQSPLNFGNLYVVRVGDGTAPLTNASTATFVDEYTPAGVFVQSIVLPTAGSGSNQPFSNSGTATSEGFLNQSSNGLYLTLAGYAVAPGLAAVPATSSVATPRVIARIDVAGQIDTSTTITDAYSGATGSNANIRSAVTVDGTAFWTSGVAATNGGVRYAALGAATSVAINAGAPTNVRVVTIQGGQLYASSATTVWQGISAVGTGTPTSGPQPVTLLNGFPTAQGPSAYDHWFADATTLYVADDRTNGSGGIQKWQLVGGTWTLQYTLALSPTVGARGLTGRRAGGQIQLWATTGSQLITVTDSGPGSPVTSIASAPANTAFRGLRFLHKPSSVQRIPAACGTASLDVAGNGEVGTDLVSTVLNPAGFAFVGYGLTPLGVPFCNCTVAHDFSFLVGGAQHLLSIPNTPSLAGILILVQGLDFLAPGGCPDPLFTLTDGFAFTLQ